MHQQTHPLAAWHPVRNPHAPPPTQGVQVRKLYYPEQFPKAAVLPIFERLYSQAPRPEVCAVGFEPNPKHTAYLGTLNAWFRRRGYSGHIFTETAAGVTKGVMPFYTAAGVTPDHQLGSSFARVPRVQGPNIAVRNVSVISLVDFITKVVRPILDAEEQATGRRPPVATKLDIEVRQRGSVVLHAAPRGRPKPGVGVQRGGCAYGKEMARLPLARKRIGDIKHQSEAH